MMKKDAELNERTSSMPSINKKCSEQSNSKQRPNNLGLSPLHLLPRNSSEFDDWERVRNFMTSPKTGRFYFYHIKYIIMLHVKQWQNC